MSEKNPAPSSDNFTGCEYSSTAVLGFASRLEREGGCIGISPPSHGGCRVCILPDYAFVREGEVNHSGTVLSGGYAGGNMPCRYELHTPLPEKYAGRQGSTATSSTLPNDQMIDYLPNCPQPTPLLPFHSASIRHVSATLRHRLPASDVGVGIRCIKASIAAQPHALTMLQA